jgi:hypothetical protein
MLDRNRGFRLAGRVLLGAYDTDGERLYETERLRATGWVIFATAARPSIGACESRIPCTAVAGDTSVGGGRLNSLRRLVP